MKKQLVIIGIVAILVSVGLSGCDQQKNPQTDQNKLVGTWNATVQNNSVTIVFFSNGTMTVTAMEISVSGTYEIKGDQLVITSQQSGMETYDYSFTLDGKLSLTKLGENSGVVYTKQ
jgi:uncharacterized protein (TIGR03066 family)